MQLTTIQYSYLQYLQYHNFYISVIMQLGASYFNVSEAAILTLLPQNIYYWPYKHFLWVLIISNKCLAITCMEIQISGGFRRTKGGQCSPSKVFTDMFHMKISCNDVLSSRIMYTATSCIVLTNSQCKPFMFLKPTIRTMTLYNYVIMSITSL